MYHNSNDFISILDIQIWVLYRILPRFSWYGFYLILMNIRISVYIYTGINVYHNHPNAQTHFVPRSQTQVKNGASQKNLNFQECVWDRVPRTLANFPSMFSCQCLITVMFLFSVPRASALC